MLRKMHNRALKKVSSSKPQVLIASKVNKLNAACCTDPAANKGQEMPHHSARMHMQPDEVPANAGSRAMYRVWEIWIE